MVQSIKIVILNAKQSLHWIVMHIFNSDNDQVEFCLVEHIQSYRQTASSMGDVKL